MNLEKRTNEIAAVPATKARRRSAPWLLGTLVLSLLFILVAQQANWLWTVVPPDSASDTLLLYALSTLNFVAFIVFAFIFVRSLLKLRRERRDRQLGSKIKTRLVVYFISLSLLPITAMAIFSYLFLNRSLEKWFSRLPEDVISELQQAERAGVSNQTRNLRETASMLAVLIGEQPELSEEQMLAQLVESGQLVAIEIISAQGALMARSEVVLPVAEKKNLARALENARAEAAGRQSEQKILANEKYYAAAVPLSGNRTLVLARTRPGSGNLTDIITGSQSEYNRLVAKQRKVRLLGLSTLGLLTLLLVFASTWSAIHIARGIAAPIRALAEASNEVARGNLSHRVTTVADDELALLADSFNQMTAQLGENRNRIEADAAELVDKNMALQERRNYIETVLESLSTGVISLDENDRVTTINPAAASMLRLTETPQPEATLADITSVEDRAVLERLTRRARRMGRATEQTQLARGSSLQEAASIPVALTATALERAPGGLEHGVVIVMEDLSELLAAQRAAAWSEVARRMAHEIKNPLTPIQLSAERIAKNFRREVSGGNGNNASGQSVDAEAERARVASIVDECTTTIAREVSGLKAMVDEFSRFARLPHAKLEVADLNDVVRQAVALYEDRLDGARMDVRLARTLPPAMLDREQLRRVFVNLIDNALEALSNVEGERRITVATAHDPSRALLLTQVTDTGHGIARKDFARLFQPYFSTRGRGTGLGLAIVQRIVTEHGGRIRAESNSTCGAKFTVEIPVTNA